MLRTRAKPSPPPKDFKEFSSGGRNEEEGGGDVRGGGRGGSIGYVQTAIIIRDVADIFIWA